MSMWHHSSTESMAGESSLVEASPETSAPRLKIHHQSGKDIKCARNKGLSDFSLWMRCKTNVLY